MAELTRDDGGGLVLNLNDKDIEVIRGNGAVIVAIETEGEESLVIQHVHATDRMN